MKLYSPETRVSRPITDRVKESLFSVLYNYDLPEGAVVADLFCGVGSLGLESLSRGARQVTFIEQNFDIFSLLKKNIDKTGLAGQSEVITANAFRFAELIESEDKHYDLVFVDPPYAKSRDVRAESKLGILLEQISNRLTAAAVVVVRTSDDVTLLEQYGLLRVNQRRKWGTMAVTLMVCGESND